MKMDGCNCVKARMPDLGRLTTCLVMKRDWSMKGLIGIKSVVNFGLTWF